MADTLGEYLYIKKYLPDLKMIILASDEDDKDYKNNSVPIFWGSVTGGQTIWGKDFGILEIEKLCLVSNNQIVSLWDPANDGNLGDIQFMKYGSAYANFIQPRTFNQFMRPVEQEMKKILSNVIGYTENPNRPVKKIYIDRGQELDRIRHHAKVVEKYINKEPLKESDLSLATDLYQQFLSNGFSNNDMITDRVVSEEDEELLKYFFEQHGYEVVDPSSMTVEEQLRLFSNITHLASYSSAVIINTLFCQPDTQIFVINPHETYNFWHPANAEISCPGNVIAIGKPEPEDMRSDPPRILTSIEIIDKLQEYQDRI